MKFLNKYIRPEIGNIKCYGDDKDNEETKKTLSTINENLNLYVPLEAFNNVIDPTLFNLHEYIMQYIINDKSNSMLLLQGGSCSGSGSGKSLYGRFLQNIYGQFLNVKLMDANLIPIFISLPKMYCKAIKMLRSNWRYFNI